jgi:hypothetical protein
MENIKIENHHAYFIVGEKEVIPILHYFLAKKLNFTVEGNPDYWSTDVETFGIEESRHLKDAHSKKALRGRKIFVVKTKFITNEAQNALLKILEDPSPRFMIIKKTGSEKSDKDAKFKFDAEQFLSFNQSTRIKLLSKIIKDKDKESVLKVIDSLEKVLRDRNYPFSLNDSRKVFELLFKSREYAYSRAASPKMILENLSLSLPKLS